MPQIWNLPTVGQGLPAVAEALYRRQADIEQNRQVARRTDLMEAEEGRRAEAFGLEKSKYEDEQHMRETYAEFQKIKAADPATQEAWAEDVRKKDPRLANTKTPDLIRAVEAGLNAKLGIRETAGQLYRTSEGYLPADQAIGKMPYDEPNAPREPSDFERWQRMTPEQRAEYERFRQIGRGDEETAPRLYPNPDPYGDNPYYRLEGGRLVPVPTGAAPAPRTAGGPGLRNRAVDSEQARTEAKAAIAAGMPREEAIRRLRAAGVDPTGI